MKKILSLIKNKIENAENLYNNSFGKFRNLAAVFSYLASIKNLPSNEQEDMMPCFQEYIENVLKGNEAFINMRYNTTEQPHLKKIFSSDTSISEKWLHKNPSVEVKSGFTIQETDNPEDLMLIGTETPSCQMVTGNPQFNKCLLGYVVNGDSLAIVIKKNNKIVARSILRLLWDETKQIPVLLQEKHYNNFKNETDLNKSIDLWAINKAKEMNLSLISKDIIPEKDKTEYEGQVVYLGGKAPFIYFDSQEGVNPGNERLEFSNCHYLYKN